MMTVPDGATTPCPYDQDQAHSIPILGMWVFLVTEWLLFGGLFLAYAIYRYRYPEAFQAMSSRMEVTLGTVNTAILLTSSLSAALAAHFAEEGAKRALFLCLTTTAGFGIAFEACKGWEYYRHVLDGVIPALGQPDRPPSALHMDIFLWLYYIMTGLHALHVAIGIGIFVTLSALCWRRTAITRHFAIMVFVTGLYWHFVDIIWIFLYPLFYLGGGK